MVKTLVRLGKLSFCREEIENAQNALKRKNMERHFQNIFVRVSHNTCKKIRISWNIEISIKYFAFTTQYLFYSIIICFVYIKNFFFLLICLLRHRGGGLRPLEGMTAKSVSFLDGFP